MTTKLMEFFKDFDQNSGGQNSDDLQILQKLDDPRILIKLSLDFDQNSADSFWKWLTFGKLRNSYEISYVQELGDHRILVQFLKDFDQNWLEY